jgi:hypothetical protein
MDLAATIKPDASRLEPLADLLGPDLEADAPVVTTRRGLCRIAFIAAEAAVRFQREAAEEDPIAWMLEPRRLFGGAAALDACLEPAAFGRAVLLHGLSIGMDASPGDVDCYRQGGDADESGQMPDDNANDGGRIECEVAPGAGGTGPRLFTALARVGDGLAWHVVLHASVCSSLEEFGLQARLALGEEVMTRASVSVGADALSLLASRAVPPSLLALLVDVEANPALPAWAGLNVTLGDRLTA